MERTWKSSAIPWSWPVPFVAFSGYTQNPMLFKFRSSTNTTTPDTTVPTTPVHNYTCPTGWSESGGNCYKYFDNSVKWDDARKRCLSEEVVILLLGCLLNLSFFTSG